MFENLLKKQPNLLLTDLIGKLGDIERNDVKQDLEKIMKERGITLFEELLLEEKECLKKLDGNGKNWKWLAEKYGFSHVERDAFNQSRIQPDSWSPTEAVLKDACKKVPGFILEDLEAILRKMERNDLANVLKKFIQDYDCLLYTSPSPRDKRQSRMPSSA